MAPSPMLKPATANKAGSGTVEEQAGKEYQRAGRSVVIQSYIGLISCNGDFDISFKRQSPAKPSNTWSTQAQTSEISVKYRGSCRSEGKGIEELANETKGLKYFVGLEDEESNLALYMKE